MHEWITTSLLGIECNFNNMSPIMNEMMPTMLLPGANTARRRTFHATRPHDTTTKTGQNGKHRCSVPENSLRKSRVSTKCEEEFDDLNLPWLFDPDRNDHLPLEEQLAMYAERDLLRGKLFNIGARLWPNDRRSRKRVFNVGGGSYSRSAPVIGDAHAVLSTGPLRPYKPHTIEPDAKELRKQAELAKRQEQKDWVEQRKRFRAQLDGLGLSEDYLRRKPNKTLMELRVLREMVAVRTAQPPSLPPPEDPPLLGILPSESPIIRRPSPVAIRIIEKYLRQKKIRLIELFAVVDKDKNWLITRDDFRKAIREAKIPISEVLLEDLVLTLDTDLDNVLDYRDLAQGMGLWKAEKWDTKRKRIAHAVADDDEEKQSLLSGLEKPPTSDYESAVGSDPADLGRPDFEHANRTSRVKSALSALSSRSSPFLEVPEPDLRPEQMILSSDEAMVDLRKRDRDALVRNLAAKKKQMKQRQLTVHSGKSQTSQRKSPHQPSCSDSDICAIIKTGDAAIDNHFQLSTLGGGTSVVLNKFRQAMFNEYVELCRMCDRAEIALTEEILKRALLYPPDKPYNKMKNQLRQPGSLISYEAITASAQNHPSLSGPGARRRLSQHPNHSNPGKGVTKSKRVSGDYNAASRVRHQADTVYRYPPAECVIKAPERVHLSTGKAYVGNKVQCWMTFEEYEQMIGKLLNGYTPLPGRCHEGAFWPGYMLDKLRLHMPDEKRDTEGAVFHRTTRGSRRSNYGYDNDLKEWPFKAGGCIQYGDIKPYYG